MIYFTPGRPPVERKVDRLIEICVTIYLVTLFTRWHEIPILAMWTGFVSWVFWADKSYLGRLKQSRTVLLWGLLLVWALACSVLSDAPGISIAAWQEYFDDHLLFVPLLVHVFATGRQEQLLRVLAWAGAVAVTLNGLLYLDDIQKGIFWAADTWLIHRKWSYPLIFFSPFLLAQVILSSGRRRWGWATALFLATAMIFGSGLRGAWLSYGFTIAILCAWLLRGGNRRLVAVLLAAVLLAFGAFSLSPQGKIVWQRAAQGLDTSHRTDGTWTPALDMVLQRPLLGHGIGMRVYHDEYARQLDAHPDWFFRDKPMHPHSFFLLALFGIGLPGLLLVTALLAACATIFLRAVRAASAQEKPRELLAVGLFATLVAHYAVRGQFQTLSWQELVVFVGCALGMALTSCHLRQGTRPEGEIRW